jgi:GGDEF domain-containing protein
VRSLRRTDLVLYQTEAERLVLVAPETHREQTLVMVERLRERAQRRFGVQLHTSVASFPEQGLTFEELLARAEQDLPAIENESDTNSPASVLRSITSGDQHLFVADDSSGKQSVNAATVSVDG